VLVLRTDIPGSLTHILQGHTPKLVECPEFGVNYNTVDTLVRMKRTMVVLFVGTVLLMTSLTGCSVFSPGSASPAFEMPPPDVQWAQAFGGSDVDEFDAVATMADGRIFAVGYTSSDDGDLADTHDHSSGASDAVLACVTAEGALRWARTFGGTGDDRFKAVAVTPDGNLVVAGYTTSKDGDFPLKPRVVPSEPGNQSDAVVAEISPGGGLRWATTLGGSGQSSFSSIAVGADGRIFVAGQTTSGDADFAGNGQGGAVVSELTQTGHVLWARMYGSDNNVFNSVALKDDGTIIAAGFTAETFNHPKDAWVMTLSSSGDVLWEHAYGGNDADMFTAVSVSRDDSIVAVGWTAAANGDFPSMAHAKYVSAVVADISSDGSLSWIKVVSTGDDNRYLAVTASSDGNIVAGGSMFPKGSKHPNEAVLAEYGESGNLVWSKTMTGNDTIIFNGLATASDGGIVAVGSTMATTGDIVSRHGSQTDAAIAKLNITGGQL